MKLSKKELRRLRLIRLHLQEIASRDVTSQTAVVERQMAERDLRWVERALLEEHPDRDELLNNIDRLDKALVRITNDILAGE